MVHNRQNQQILSVNLFPQVSHLNDTDWQQVINHQSYYDQSLSETTNSPTHQHPIL